MKKRLAIVGTHTETRDLAPFDDPDTDIWVFNESAQSTKEYYPGEPERQWCKRWDGLLQIHKPEVYQSKTNWVINSHWDWLQKTHGDKPIWMQEQDPLVPNSRKYPLEEIIKTVPGASLKWFTSTVTYAIALGIYQGYTSIGLYGLDMESNTEYGYQLPNFLFFMGVCYGLNIDLYFVCNKKYFSEKLYGYEGETQIPRDYFTKRKEMMYSSWKEKSRQSDHLKSRFMTAVDERKYDEIIKIIIEWRAVVIEAGQYSGAEQEATNYESRQDHISRQEYERRSAQAALDGAELKELMYITMGKLEYVYNAWRQTGMYQPLEQLRIFVVDEMKIAYEAGGKHGAYTENLEYMKEYDDLLQAAGGLHTLSAMKGETSNGK